MIVVNSFVCCYIWCFIQMTGPEILTVKKRMINDTITGQNINWPTWRIIQGVLAWWWRTAEIYPKQVNSRTNCDDFIRLKYTFWRIMWSTEMPKCVMLYMSRSKHINARIWRCMTNRVEKVSLNKPRNSHKYFLACLHVLGYFPYSCN
jgi:hypothetical protein